MIVLRIDLYVHSADENRIEKKLDAVFEAIKGLRDDPAKLAGLAEELKKPTENLQTAVEANQPPTP